MNSTLLRYLTIISIVMLAFAFLSSLHPSTGSLDSLNAKFLELFIDNFTGMLVFLCFFHMFVLPLFGLFCLFKRLYLKGTIFIIAPILFYISVID